MVRSSAVYSEDSEKTSGAGIYESVGDIQSLDDFKKAVQSVFESVESEKAKAHRKMFNISEEYM
jgi:phosphoenolpyruvate synthase/pyruvate phosphate dikinase